METFVLHKEIKSPSPSSDESRLLLLVQAWTVTEAGVQTLIDTAAGDVVLNVQNQVIDTPDQNVSVGDGDSATRFLAAGTVTLSAATTVVPYKYAAADTIDITAASSASSGSGVLYVLVYRP